MTDIVERLLLGRMPTLFECEEAAAEIKRLRQLVIDEGMRSAVQILNMEDEIERLRAAIDIINASHRDELARVTAEYATENERLRDELAEMRKRRGRLDTLNKAPLVG